MFIFTYFSQISNGLFKLQNQITFVKTVILKPLYFVFNTYVIILSWDSGFNIVTGLQAG